MNTFVEQTPVRNKTEASEPQDELHLIADALPVFIARLDLNERYLFNNRAYENFFGPQALR